jgi:hypothetical protein
MVHYATLSYCWGEASDLACTTQEKLAEGLLSVLLRLLLRAIRDAVDITRTLGVGSCGLMPCALYRSKKANSLMGYASFLTLARSTDVCCSLLQRVVRETATEVIFIEEKRLVDLCTTTDYLLTTQSLGRETL